MIVYVIDDVIQPHISLADLVTKKEHDERAYDLDKRVKFQIADVNSQFPSAEFEQLITAMNGELDLSSNSIKYEAISNLKLSSFTFYHHLAREVFTLSMPNYFVQQSDDVKECYLAVTRSVDNNWVIGAALAKTYEIVFRKLHNAGTYVLGFTYRPYPNSIDI